MAENENIDTTQARSKLTAQELAQLEQKEKSPLEKRLDHLICFFPVIATLIHLLEYLYVPNYPGNMNTYTYAIILAVWLGYFIIRGVLSVVSENQQHRWRHKAPFQTLIVFLLMGYDILTLKTGLLILPYFPWVDKLLHAMISERSFLLESTLSSLGLLFEGFSIGALVGIITGILAGYFEKTHYWISPFVTVIGSIPTTTWIPIVMVLAASLRNGALFVIALGVFFALHNATFSGVRAIDSAYFEVAETLGAKQKQLISSITLPAILPNIFTGLIQGMSTACTSLIVAEMMGVESGLGFYITWQKNWAEYDKMYGGIIVICLMFLAVHFILRFLEAKLLKWKDA